MVFSAVNRFGHRFTPLFVFKAANIYDEELRTEEGVKNVSERLKLGEIVLRAGIIDELQLEAALGEQKKWGGRLGLVLIRMGYVTEANLVQALAGQLNLPVATLAGKKIPARVLELVPYEYADSHTCLPLFIKEEEGRETLFVAMDDPSNLDVLDDIAFRTALRVKPVVVATSEICRGIECFYREVEPSSQNASGALDMFFTEGPALIVPGDNRGFGNQLDENGQLLEEPDEFAPSPLATVADEMEDEKPLSEVREEPSNRIILHALTQILIEKGVMTREEFYYRVRALTGGDQESDEQG